MSLHKNTSGLTRTSLVVHPSRNKEHTQKCGSMPGLETMCVFPELKMVGVGGIKAGEFERIRANVRKIVRGGGPGMMKRGIGRRLPCPALRSLSGW